MNEQSEKLVEKNTMDLPIACLKDVSVVYGRFVALYNINLDIYRGDFIGVCGPNGSGKTTLFKTIMGLKRPLTGIVKLFGYEINNGIPKDIKYKIGYVPQFQPFDRNFPALVKDVVEMGRYGKIGLMKGLTKRDREIVDKAIKMVGIEDLVERPIGHLSGGQQQKVMIAQALTTEAELLLLDEPTSALDFKMTEELMELLDYLNHTHKITLVTINHNITLLQDFAKRIVCLNKIIAYDGPPKTKRLQTIINKIFYS